jgi:rubredoxin
MEHWMCSHCNYIHEADAPSELCPSCGTKCEMYDVSCYIPECGGPGHIDERLVMDKMKEQRKGQL